MIFNKLDVDLFSFIVLLITYLNSSHYQKNTKNYLQFLKGTTLCILMILFIDIFVNILEANLINYVFIKITFLLISINGILTPLAPFFWTIFLYYYLTPNNKNNKRKIWLISIPMLLNAGLMVYNIFNPILFNITIENGYTRGKYFIVFSIISAFYILVASILIIKQKKQLNKYEFWILFSFEVFPLLGGALQSLFYGSLFTYPLSALSLTLIYIYLRQDISILDYVSKAYTVYYFDSFCNKYIIQNKKSDYSLCYIDIDNLSKINNTFGYTEGDYVLSKFVEIVNDCIQEPDFITCANGDEFIIYFNNNDEKQIIQNLKIIARNVEYYNLTSKKPYNINFTFVYYVNKNTNNSPFKILKTLYMNLAIKKERKLLENKYKPYIKKMS